SVDRDGHPRPIPTRAHAGGLRGGRQGGARPRQGHGGRRGAPGFRIPELALEARRAVPDRRLRCRLYPQRRPGRRKTAARIEAGLSTANPLQKLPACFEMACYTRLLSMRYVIDGIKKSVSS